MGSEKISTTNIPEIKMKDNVVEKASTLVATMDNGGNVSNISASISNRVWIIDYGATDRMTFDSKQVSPFRPSS